MAELKPCPFCGSEAVYNAKNMLIECKRCKATIYGSKIYRFIPNNKDLLCRLWNRRAEDGK